MVWLLLVLFADQFDTTFKAGLIALNGNQLAAAESNLKAASQLQPRNAGVWLALAQTYWKLNKQPEARVAARNAEGFEPNAVVLHGLAVFYLQTEDSTKGAEMLQAAIVRNPYEESYYFELAQVRLKQQDFGAALQTLDGGVKQFAKSAQLQLAAGVAYYGLRRFAEAIDAFLRTIQLDPSIEQAYVFLGRVADQAEERLPKITEAFAAFAKAAPDNPLSSLLYGKALLMGENPDQAETWFRKSIALKEGVWEPHFELGVLLDQRGRFEEAAREIRRSIDLNPGDPALHYRMARLYDRLGKVAEARAEREVHAKLTADDGRGMAGIK